ncbi:hypothetical protein [Anaplasma phagocytophilum]|uniref:hypothetical protein n=1 Tax=Anaplasma phagocytophilum TaxID=948 RepID=UPI000B1AF65F|nr:hypothetical protein [Anaplasma phagocytophilum]
MHGISAVSVSDIRIIDRSTQGVTLFKTEKGEKVLTVAPIIDSGDNCDDDEGAGEVSA